MIKVVNKYGLSLLLILLLAAPSVIRAQDLAAAIKLTRSEQFASADKLFQELIKAEPANGDVYFYYGDNFLKMYFGDTLNMSLRELAGSARQMFAKGIEVDPANPINYAGLAEVALLQKKLPEAQEYINAGYALLPTRKNKIVMAPEKHAMSLVKMADAFIRAGVKDTAQILTFLREAQSKNPKETEIYLVRGDAFIFLLNDGSNAIANYNIAQSLNARSAMAKLRTGQLWMRAKQYQMALNYYEEVVQIDSTFAPAYRELGFLLSKAGRYNEAKKMFRRFLELSQGNTAARLQFINTLMELGDYQEAIVEINLVLASDTTITDLYRALAYSDFENANYTGGLEAMEKFLSRSDPEKIRYSDKSYYGRLLSKTGQDSLAAISLYEAYLMDSTKTDILSEAAMSYIKIKDYTNAIRIYELKDSLHAANALDLYNWAKSYYNIKDYEKAAIYFERFTREQPTYVPGFEWLARTMASLDPDSDAGLAKPVYEQILVLTKEDTAKYVKQRMEAYYYMAYYFYHQYVLKKDVEFARESLKFNQEVLAIEPENEKAKQMVDALKRVVK